MIKIVQIISHVKDNRINLENTEEDSRTTILNSTLKLQIQVL